MKKSLLALAACAMMTVPSEAALYLIGQPGGQEWSPMIGTPMEEVDGGWTWSGFVGETDYFAFATQLMDTNDWDTFNANYRISPEGDGVVAAEGEYDMHIGQPEGAFKGCDSELTLFVKEADGKYTLTVTEKKMPSLYMVGQVDGNIWDPQVGVKMKNVEGGWEWTGKVGENDFFAFATKLMEPDPSDPDANLWTEFNENYRLSPVVDNPDEAEDRNVQAAAGKYAMRFGMPEGAFFGTGREATYFVEELDGVYSLTVTEKSFGSPDDTWSVVGEFNDWGSSPDFQMTKIGDGVWKATMYDFSGKFKFRANNTWDLNFGAAGIVEDPEIGYILDMDGVFSISQNGADFNIPEEVEEVVFILDVNNQTLTVDGLTPSFLALRGSFVDWDFEWSYLFQEVDDDVYMLYLDGVDKDWQFKIADQTWSEEYTTGVLDMSAGEIYELMPGANKDNMGVDNNYLDVTMFFNLEDMIFWFEGEVADSVARTEIAEGKARYYNLQGCEVSNPADGIYIRVVNGKSEKISVK